MPMPGIGIARIRMDMMIKSKLIAMFGQMHCFFMHYKKTILPYGVIAVVLAGIWFLWDNPNAKQDIKPEMKQANAASPASKPAVKTDSTSGALVQSTAQAMRYKPLPDLFASSLPKQKESGLPVNAGMSLDAKGNYQAAPEQPVSWPVVLGTIQSRAKRLVVLQSGDITRVCAAGDTVNGFYVAYIHEEAVGLQKDMDIVEIPL